MLSRIKLYFTPYKISDRYYKYILKRHGLNPCEDYNKNIHRIQMLECVLQIFTALAHFYNDKSYNKIIETYQSDIATLKSKEQNDDKFRKTNYRNEQ